MAYYLEFTAGGNNYVTLPSQNIGSANGDYLEIDVAFTGSNYRLLGRTGGYGDLIEFSNSSTLNIRFSSYSNNTVSVTRPSIGTRFKLRLERTNTATNQYTVTVDGGSAVTLTNSDTFQIGTIGAIATSFFGDLDLYAFEVGNTSGKTEFYNPSSSGGTGSILPDDEGGTSGTLVNFPTDDSQWVFYSAGGSISASIAQTITKPVFSVSSSFVAPVTISADIAYTIAKPIFATTASKVVPTFTSDLAFNVAKPVFATAASTTVPTFTSALAVDISKPVFAVSADNGQLVITSAIAASISKPVFSVAADNQVLIVNSAIALSVSKPIFSIASSSIVPIFTVNTAFDINKPIFSIASTATEPGNASASIAVLVDAPIFSVNTSLINPLLSTIDFSIDAPVFSVLNSATRPTLTAEITVDVTAPTFSVIANNGIQVYYYRSGTQVITYSQNTQIKIRTLNTNQQL